MPSKKKKYSNRFPPARIKKIMQKDEDVGKVAAAVPVIIARALELFIETLIKKSNELTLSKNARTLTPQHIKQTILIEKEFDFLKDLVENIPDVQNYDEDEKSEIPHSQPELQHVNHHESKQTPTIARSRGRPKKIKVDEFKQVEIVKKRKLSERDENSNSEESENDESDSELSTEKNNNKSQENIETIRSLQTLKTNVDTLKQQNNSNYQLTNENDINRSLPISIVLGSSPYLLSVKTNDTRIFVTTINSSIISSPSKVSKVLDLTKINNNENYGTLDPHLLSLTNNCEDIPKINSKKLINNKLEQFQNIPLNLKISNATNISYLKPSQKSQNLISGNNLNNYLNQTSNLPNYKSINNPISLENKESYLYYQDSLRYQFPKQLCSNTLGENQQIYPHGNDLKQTPYGLANIQGRALNPNFKPDIPSIELRNNLGVDTIKLSNQDFFKSNQYSQSNPTLNPNFTMDIMRFANNPYYNNSKEHFPNSASLNPYQLGFVHPSINDLFNSGKLVNNNKFSKDMTSAHSSININLQTNFDNKNYGS